MRSRLTELSQPAAAAVLSLAVGSTEERLEFRHGPPSAAAPSRVRRPAQAGRFYPADSNELRALLDRFWQRPVAAPRPWAACVVPHAGPVFSGHLAADVLRHVKLSESLLIIGPKHTPFGADWALAPFERWEIPVASVARDLQLSHALAQAILCYTFDAAADTGEHGIEVRLPLIARAALQARIAVIAIGRADLRPCLEFAADLASVLRSLPRPPLLMISSDMNYFADDATTRQLDALALSAMQRLAPAHLFDAVTENGITMCGLLPAVFVMETLRLFGGLTAIEPVGYATSTDVTGASSRVIGYYGVMLTIKQHPFCKSDFSEVGHLASMVR